MPSPIDSGILVSIIMPAYNAAPYITKSIESVLNQSWGNWELLVVNDGSSDNTEGIILSFDDSRIKYFKQKNKGVSAARNVGLHHMKGSFFCFLDADDLMPINSLKSRISIFENNPELAFVGGAQIQMDEDLDQVLLQQNPTYKGSPLKGLIMLDPGCFINCGTWLIKRNFDREYHFYEDWTHGEDLAFFFSIAEDGNLDFTESTAQIYRRSNKTAMANLKGLENGYKQYFNLVKKSGRATKADLFRLKIKSMKIMFLSYLSQRMPNRAIKSALALLIL